MAARIGQKSHVWFRDPSTWPLIACIAGGAVMCGAFGTRHLTKSPDVKWNRETRMSQKLPSKDQEEWTAHRKTLLNLRENPVNAHNKEFRHHE